MEKNLLYVYLPRDKILNRQKRKYKKKDDTIDAFYYIKNKKFQVDGRDIQEVDIYKHQLLKKNCFYKNEYQSKNDDYFDYYFKLKPEYNNLETVYIEKNIKKDKLRLSYNKNLEKIRKNIGNFNKNYEKTQKKVENLKKKRNPFVCYFD